MPPLNGLNTMYFCQQTRKYIEFLETIEKTQGAGMYYVSIALVGERRPVLNQASKPALFEQVAS
jgi:hypothetical protein